MIPPIPASISPSLQLKSYLCTMAGGRDCDLWWREDDSPGTVELVSPATVWEGVEVVLQPCQSDSREASVYNQAAYLLPLHAPALDRTEAGGPALGIR